jgi:hypothetical protein
MTEEQHAILIRLDEKVDHLVTIRLDHEKRIRGLEKARNIAGALVGIIASILGIKTTTLL